MSLLNFSNPPIRMVDLGTGSKVSEKTVKEMIKLIYNSSQNQYVRSWAEKIIANVPPRDEMGEIEAIYYFVRDNCRYTKDMLGAEYFMTPHYLLQKLDKGEVPMGDCDDLCLLSLSLLRSIGFFTKIRITSYTPGSDFSHVYGLVCLGGNGDGISGRQAEWIPVDCIRRQEPFMWEAPNPIKVRDFLVDG